MHANNCYCSAPHSTAQHSRHLSDHGLHQLHLFTITPREQPLKATYKHTQPLTGSLTQACCPVVFLIWLLWCFLQASSTSTSSPIPQRQAIKWRTAPSKQVTHSPTQASFHADQHAHHTARLYAKSFQSSAECARFGTGQFSVSIACFS